MKISPFLTKAEMVYEYLLRHSYDEFMFARMFSQEAGRKIEIDIQNKSETMKIIKEYIELRKAKLNENSSSHPF